MLTVNGRIESPAPAARNTPGNRLKAPAAAVAARSSRRVGNIDMTDMTSSGVYPICSDAGPDPLSAEVNLLHYGVGDTLELIRK
jgi:hypothetical protein